MDTTPRDLIVAAYGKSLKNNAGQIATEETELLNTVIRIFQSIFAGAARVNPYFFATREDVSFGSEGWARPSAAQLICRLEAVSCTGILAGTEIKVVPFDQRTIEPGFPSVYRFGQTYFPASSSATVPPLAPQDGDIKFFYAKSPDRPATLDDTVDALWPEEFNELPILRIAHYLAEKDGRADEMGMLAAELDEIARAFVAFLEHETANEVRAYGNVVRFQTPSLIPVLSLLTGVARDAA